MSKKILMIAENDIASTSSLGVTKKLKGQYKAFCNLGYDTYFLCLENEQAVLIHGEDRKVVVPRQVKGYFTVAKMFLSAAKVCKDKGIEVCYIRYPLADWAFMHMIKALHEICKVVVEIPTYPYDKQVVEEKSIVAKFNHFQDKKNRKKLQRCIDKFVSPSAGFDTIYGVDCVEIANGVDVDTIPYIAQFDYSKIDLIGVALVAFDHGYDRLIYGISKYVNDSPQSDVCFHIVGNGPALPELKQLCKRLSVEKYVHFYGSQYGDDLDKTYCSCNIGVSILGGHRSGFVGSGVPSCLKAKEYCARGVPFISASRDNAIDENTNFYKLFPANDDPIDIHEVIAFADYISTHPEIHMQMRKYAEENLTWEKQLSKVMECIE